MDHASAAAVIRAARRCQEVLTDRLTADPDTPVAEDLRTLITAAHAIEIEYERRTA